MATRILAVIVTSELSVLFACLQFPYVKSYFEEGVPSSNRGESCGDSLCEMMKFEWAKHDTWHMEESLEGEDEAFTHGVDVVVSCVGSLGLKL